MSEIIMLWIRESTESSIKWMWLIVRVQLASFEIINCDLFGLLQNVKPIRHKLA